MMNTETKEFLAEFLPKFVEAERQIHAGDAQPRIDLWSRDDPVTLLGAKESAQGWTDLEPMFKTVASWFSDPVSYDFEVIAAGASGDLAYLVGYERNEVLFEGKPKTYTLRSTHVFRREDGEWRAVHRHADMPPEAGAKLFAED